MSDVARRVGGGLGPNQIAWLRAHVPAFEEAWKAVKASDAHAAKIRERLEARVRAHEAAKAAERYDIEVVTPMRSRSLMQRVRDNG